MIDFGTSQSPKSTRPLTTYWCPSRPGHQALRNNFASSLLLRTWLPYDWTPRSEAYFASPLALCARRVSTATGGYQPSLRSPWLAAVYDLSGLDIGAVSTVCPIDQVCLRPRDRFWDIPVPKIDSAFDNLLVPQPSWSPSTTQQ
ncbi:hypothetical protein, partial [Thiolapillus sp.]|uniref:hypothetical protein n=1 Tax=Thiolapillus sp. TaxID=2017437 RepID=UPI003AF4F9AC